jgi:hypothetical protein
VALLLFLYCSNILILFPDPPKRQKAFATLLGKDNSSAISLLMEEAERFGDGSKKRQDPKIYCIPSIGESTTWNMDEMREQLLALREAIQLRLPTFKPTDRQKVVIGIRLGSGCGKTHVLSEAPSWLAAEGIYVTYNQHQKLLTDEKHPEKAILIRLILALMGCGSVGCGQFFQTEASLEFFGDRVTIKMLRDLFVWYAKSQFESRDIVIGIDELKELTAATAGQVIAELGHLTHAYYLADPISRCTVLVTSLTWLTFETPSGRPVENWAPKAPDDTALDHFAKRLSGRKDQHVALMGAVSGAHMRSLVIAYDQLRMNFAPTVEGLFQAMTTRLGNKIAPTAFPSVVEYVRNCITSMTDPGPVEAIELYSLKDFSLPPVLVCKAFEDVAHDASKPLHSLFNSISFFDTAPKQLEEMAKQYDFLRSALRLPVVPRKADVCMSGSIFEKAEWYRGLTFPDSMEECKTSLLVFVSKTKGVRATSTVPTFGTYYHPSAQNHPWIDRAFVAQGIQKNTFCLVLAQDKVNATDFPSACLGLNRAAEMLSQSSNIQNVLLIVNVIGASEQTSSQSSLKYPYILIRGANEVSKFYSRNFAVMIGFARKRHQLSA